jgi:lysophospholipase L1-like esterase
MAYHAPFWYQFFGIYTMSSFTQPQIEASPVKRFLRRIEEKSQNIKAPTVVIVAFGDSVTAGATFDNRYLQDEVYHQQLRRLLEEQYPHCLFSVINAGIGGESATVGGMSLMERDVLHHKPDLLLIGFSLNDAAGRELEGIPDFKQAMAALVKRARQETEADIVLLTPNMMPFYNNGKIPERWSHLEAQFVRLQTEGIMAAYAQAIREVGAEQTVAVADVYAAWEALEAKGVATTEMLANGLNHPDAEGHRIAAKCVFHALLPAS